VGTLKAGEYADGIFVSTYSNVCIRSSLHVVIHKHGVAVYQIISFRAYCTHFCLGTLKAGD